MSNDLPQLPGLKGTRIVLGVCGGIAAYKSAELVRLLTKQGCAVQVVMTPSATQFIAPLTFQALSGRAVAVSQWPEGQADRGMPHIDISRACDHLLIAPCTANSLAKYVHGIADNLLDNLVLARNCPVAVVPAMNVEMWNNPATQRNVEQARRDGLQVFGPAHGEQACGEVGQGRMLEPWEIVWELAKARSTQTLTGQHVVVSAGPTFEAIDPVRGITNRSSGKMGYAIAQAAWLAGAKVTLVSGPTALATPYGVQRVNVQGARDMHSAVLGLVPQAQAYVGVAAVADYGILNPSTHKQKKSDASPTGLNMEFTLNPDILAEVGQWATEHSPRFKVIGFAAETQNLADYAQQKLVRKKAHAIVANFAQEVLGADEATLQIYRTDLPPVTIERKPKLEAALDLIHHLFSHP